MKKKSSYTLLLAMRRHVESFAQLPYLFKEAGFIVHVAYTDYTRIMRFSGNVDVLHSIPYPSADFSFALLKVIKDGDFDLVLYVDEPAVTSVYSSSKLSEFSRWLPFSLESALSKSVGCKRGFHEFMELHKLPTPRTHVVNTSDDLHKCINNGFKYPFVIKAPRGSSGNGVFMVKSENELNGILNDIKIEEGLIVQEYISGQVIVATFLAVNGIMKCHIVAEKTIASNSGKGPSVAARFVDNESVGQICRQIAKAGNISGITGLDLMMDDKGNVYGIDPHFGRMTTHIHFGPYCGIHFGHMLRECLDGDFSEKMPARSLHSVVKYPEFLSLAFEGGLIKLFRDFPVFSKYTKYLIKQPNDSFLAFVQGSLGIYHCFRCFGGRLKLKTLKYIRSCFGQRSKNTLM